MSTHHADHELVLNSKKELKEALKQAAREFKQDSKKYEHVGKFHLNLKWYFSLVKLSGIQKKIPQEQAPAGFYTEQSGDLIFCLRL